MNAALDTLMILSLLMYPNGTTSVTAPNPLDSFSAEPVKAVTCKTKDLPADSIEETLDNIVFDGISVSVVRTEDNSIKAAIRNIFEYSEFYVIDEAETEVETDETDKVDSESVNTEETDTSEVKIEVDMDTFRDLFGQSGIVITYDDGIDTEKQLYFTFDINTPVLILESENELTQAGEYLIEKDNTDRSLSMYRFKNNQIYRYDLNAELTKLFPDALNVTVSYQPNYRYENHIGLFLIDCQISEDYKYENYVGWLENDSLTIIKSSDMVLPPYKYTPTEPNTDVFALDWLNENLGGEFILSEKIDPTKLSGDELKEYMDEAYEAGLSILRVFYHDSGIMYCEDPYLPEYEIYYVNGKPFTKLNNPAFSNLSAFETYMRKILSEDMVKSLLDLNMFIDYDGELWGVMGARGSNINRKFVETKITNVTENDITYVCVIEERERLDDESAEIIELEFHYTKTDDGWRWTALELFN